MAPETLALLTNKEVIAIDQDAAGKQGDRVSTEGPIEVWSRHLADGSQAVGIFNRHHTALTTTVDFRTLGFTGPVKARDLWKGEQKNLNSSFQTTVPAHGVVFLKVSQ